MLGSVAASHSLVPPPSYSDLVITDGAVAYWRLGDPSGTAMNDSSGNARHGTYSNTPTLGVSGALVGDADTAVTFNGTDEFASITYGAWMAIGSGAGGTIEYWAKSTTLDGMVMARQGTSGSGGSPWYLSISSGNPAIQVWRSDNNVWSLRSSISVNNGSWHHVVIPWDVNGASIYVDGVLDSSPTLTGTPNGTIRTESVGLYVGRRPSGIYLAATLDEIAIYPTKLTLAQIQAHHGAGT